MTLSVTIRECAITLQNSTQRRGFLFFLLFYYFESNTCETGLKIEKARKYLFKEEV